MFPLYDTQRGGRIPFINLSLIALNVLVFFFEQGLGDSGLRAFIGTWGLVPARLIAAPLDSGAWLPFLSAMFIHGGWLHLISNLWILFIFGDNVEASMGGLGYLLFYLMSGIAAALLQTFVLPLSSVPMVGASGAIAGVLGAYMLLFPQARVVTLLPLLFVFTTVELPAVIFLLFWFVTQLFSGVMSLGGVTGSGIAWWAHIGGFAFGILAVFVFAQRRRARAW